MVYRSTGRHYIIIYTSVRVHYIYLYGNRGGGGTRATESSPGAEGIARGCARDTQYYRARRRYYSKRVNETVDEHPIEIIMQMKWGVGSTRVVVAVISDVLLRYNWYERVQVLLCIYIFNTSIYIYICI